MRDFVIGLFSNVFSIFSRSVTFKRHRKAAWLLTVFFLLHFYSIVERAGSIVRELDVTPNRGTWRVGDCSFRVRWKIEKLRKSKSCLILLVSQSVIWLVQYSISWVSTSLFFLCVVFRFGFLGSIDSNTGSPDLGWDTDQFPMDIKNCTFVMKVGDFD